MDPNLRADLKTQTATAHVELERLLDVMNPNLDRERWFAILGGFQDFYRGFESHVDARAAQGCAASRFYQDGRRKLPLLQQDLGAGAAVRTPPPAFDWLDCTAKMWGALYVVEGSTLGGQVITPHLKKLETRLGSPAGQRFFQGYGPETGRRWQSFLTELLSLPTSESTNIVDGARGTFQAMIDHFKRAFGLES